MHIISAQMKIGVLCTYCLRENYVIVQLPLLLVCFIANFNVIMFCNHWSKGLPPSVKWWLLAHDL